MASLCREEDRPSKFGSRLFQSMLRCCRELERLFAADSRIAPGRARFHVLFACRRNHKGVVDGFLLKADDLWKPQAGQQLHVEDFFDCCLKFKESDHLAAPEIDDGNAAFELVAALGKWNAIHGR